MYQQVQINTLISRLKEPHGFIQVLMGPRQGIVSIHGLKIQLLKV